MASERFRTEIGLVIFIAIEIQASLFIPFGALFFPFTISPLFTADIELAISILLTLLALAGQILVVSGRRPFGSPHSRWTVIGLVLWIGVAGFDLFILPYSLGIIAVRLTWTVVLTVQTLSEIIATAISVIGVSLLTYGIQSRKGRSLLWLACAIGLSVAIAFDSQNLQIFPYYPLDVQKAILALGAVSTVLFAAAFYLAWSRIRSNGDLPKREATPLEISRIP